MSLPFRGAGNRVSTLAEFKTLPTFGASGDSFRPAPEWQRGFGILGRYYFSQSTNYFQIPRTLYRHGCPASLAKWVFLYPNSLTMQPDKVFCEKYDSLGNYGAGKSRSDLTRTESRWASTAFDWKRLKNERVLGILTQSAHFPSGNREILARPDCTWADFPSPAGLSIWGDTIFPSRQKQAVFKHKQLIMNCLQQKIRWYFERQTSFCILVPDE